MGIPTIKLNLAPPPTVWRLHHAAISWTVLAIGTIGLGFSIIATVKAYKEAEQAGQMTVSIAEQARMAQMQQNQILVELRDVQVDKEMPRWKLAERILLERTLPWSRLTAELERSLVQDVRLKSIQRTRGNDQSVQLKLRGDAKSEAAETNFIESLHENLAFAHVFLERDAEMQNSKGMWEFDYTLQLSSAPPPYELLPKYGPVRSPARPPAATSNTPAPRAQTPPTAQGAASRPGAAPAQQTQPAPRPQNSPASQGAASRPAPARTTRQQGNPPRPQGGSGR
jgi:hypothetical protein